jgi:hypothetical protein
MSLGAERIGVASSITGQRRMDGSAFDKKEIEEKKINYPPALY